MQGHRTEQRRNGVIPNFHWEDTRGMSWYLLHDCERSSALRTEVVSGLFLDLGVDGARGSAWNRAFLLSFTDLRHYWELLAVLSTTGIANVWAHFISSHCGSSSPGGVDVHSSLACHLSPPIMYD